MKTDRIMFHAYGDNIKGLLTGLHILPDVFTGLFERNLEARIKDHIIEVFPEKGIKTEIDISEIKNEYKKNKDGSITFSLSMTVGSIGYAIGSPFHYRLYPQHPED